MKPKFSDHKVILELIPFCCVIAFPRSHSFKVVSYLDPSHDVILETDTTLRELKRGDAMTQQKSTDSRTTFPLKTWDS